LAVTLEKETVPMSDQQAMQRVGIASAELRVAAFVQRVWGLLVPGEQIEAWAVQRRWFALFRRRTFVVATTGRLLVFTRNLFAGFDMRDARWQDVCSVHIRVGAFGADLSVGVLDGADLASAEQARQVLTVRGLRKAQGQEVYRLCQGHDQAWREKRRVRDLEELRARSGGLHLGGGVRGGVTAGALPAPGEASGEGSGELGETDALVARLQAAKDMLSKGLITDAEYEALKAKILSGM
jgi:Short C-terminal domain